MKTQKSSKKTITEYTPKSFAEVVPRLPGESQRKYETLKLYCQEDSLVKLSKKLDSLLKGGNCPKPILGNKGRPPSLRTLERWSKKFEWIERKEPWTTEECRQLFYTFEKQRDKIFSLVSTIELEQKKESKSAAKRQRS